ncbi:unnamed protein product (mitochondrion) [Plasmodiophora brassicae]|uniref:Homeobox domain-containing protein n=1 Tax=Plasmodiophora brassicae TaxID=37360 RepID=A0A3P3Y177_PLABS|nr:unnamed protein product [Plasmodiophora brassicae]
MCSAFLYPSTSSASSRADTGPMAVKFGNGAADVAVTVARVSVEGVPSIFRYPGLHNLVNDAIRQIEASMADCDLCTNTKAKRKRGTVASHASQQRARLPRDLVRTLQGWYTEHMDHPYPSEEQKDEWVASASRMHPSVTKKRVSTWFANARKRLGMTKGKRRRRIV